MAANRTADRVQAMLNWIGGDDKLNLLIAGRAKLTFELISPLGPFNTFTAPAAFINPYEFFTSTERVWVSENFMKLVLNKSGREVIGSFETKPGKGLPLGNLTSQLLVNVYMNEFDQYLKHTLKIRYYLRYADDFVVFSNDKKYLVTVLRQMRQFLEEKLALPLHPQKVTITTIASGVDFLGWVHFPTHRVLRTVTKKRLLRNIIGLKIDSPTVQSYLGLLKHGNAQIIRSKINTKLLGEVWLTDS